MPLDGANGLTKSELSKELRKLREDPLDTSGVRDSILNPFFDYLVCVKPGADRALHWFCKDADDLTRESATFLLRLFAYDNEVVRKWKEYLLKCLHSCSACVQSLDRAKTTSRSTYFGAFALDVINNFWTIFDDWEVQSAIAAVKQAGVSQQSVTSLAGVPSSVLFHLFSKAVAFKYSFVLDVLAIHTLPTSVSSWPKVPPAGAFLLALHESTDIRSWVAKRWDFSLEIDAASVTMQHEYASQAVVERIARKSLGSTSDVASAIARTFPFISSDAEFWSVVESVVCIFPPALARSSGVASAVISHLHDSGPHFGNVLRCTFLLVRKMGAILWEGEGNDYAQVVFDSIKDNSAFSSIFMGFNPALKEKPWFFAGFLDILSSLWSAPGFGEVLARQVAFLFDELQHERFMKNRPLAMASGMQLLEVVLRKAAKSESTSQARAVSSVIDIHSSLIIAVCCSGEYTGSDWIAPRKHALSLLNTILLVDIQAIASAVVKVSKASVTIQPDDLPPMLPKVRQKLWQHLYSSIRGDDSDSCKLIIELAATSAKVDKLPRNAYRRRIVFGLKPATPNPRLLESLDKAMTVLDGSLDIVRDGFLNAVERFASTKTSKQISEFLGGPKMIEHIMALMLSPVDDYHASAQALVEQAFDVEGRKECFRKFFDMWPEASFMAVRTYMEAFHEFARTATEPCSLSTALVRCLSDVTEVLGVPGGLLKDAGYVEKVKEANPTFLAAELPKFWKSMAFAISIIFNRFHHCAHLFDKSEMAPWARDALIFARELLDRRHAFEAAALFVSGQGMSIASPRKLSSIGKRMINDLQGVLYDLQNWLRLADMELLYQAFELLKSLMNCFKDAGIKPNNETLTKMRKFVDTFRKSSDRPVSFLSDSDIAELVFFLADFDEDDDVQIVPNAVGRKLFDEMGKKDAVSAAPVIKNEKPRKIVTSSVAGPSSVRAKGGKGKERDSSSEPETIVTVNKPIKKPLPSFTKLKKVDPPPKKRSVYDPKYEGRPVPSKINAPGSDSDDSDSEDGGSGLAQLAKMQDSPEKREKIRHLKEQAKKPGPRRQIQLIEDPRLTLNRANMQRDQRREDARKNTMRLKPDITPLHRMLLSWNYDHKGDEPPFVGSRPVLSKIPDRFEDYESYMRVFLPLLKLECWSQITKSKEETNESFECKIVGRQFVDDWIDMDVDFTEPPRYDWRLTDVDVVLMRNITTQKCFMAKVGGFRRSPFVVQVSIRCFAAMQADAGFSSAVGSLWRMSQVFSLSTLHREFAALVGLQCYDLADVIFRPQLAEPPQLSQGDVEKAVENYKVNEPQARAILSAMKTNGFSLIQGPPGTGKTWTICGLVGAFIASRTKPATTIQVGRQGPNEQKKSSSVAKVLVCAPSNAAIDEVAKRLKEGVYGPSGAKVVPKVVRVGADSSINISAKDISLDTLVDIKLNASDNSKTNVKSELTVLRTEIQAIRTMKEMKQEELGLVVDNAARIYAIEQEIQSLNTKRMNLSQQLDRLKDMEKNQSRTLDAVRRKARQEVMEEADIICSTLSGAGHELLDQFDFKMVIIDEACQSIELSSLIPLKYRCQRCVMVGDPQQLPPTVLSPVATRWGYDQSLFLRLQRERPSAVHLLSIQYRMHPQISSLPSRIFYEGRLEDGPGMAEKTIQPWHSESKFGVYKFFNVQQGYEEQGRIGHSILNREECKTIMALFDRLRRQFTKINFDYRIGIVTMYRAQVQELKRLFKIKFGDDILGRVDFNTVDGFQGQEKDIIILSCVRSGNALTSVGFLADTRRMNVAITRSRCSLYIVGNGPTLERSNEVWKGIVNDARSRSCYVDISNISYFTAPIQASAPVDDDAMPISKKQRNRRQSNAPVPQEGLFTPKEMMNANRSPGTALRKKPSSSGIKTNGKRKSEIEHSGRPSPSVRAASVNRQASNSQNGGPLDNDGPESSVGGSTASQPPRAPSVQRMSSAGPSKQPRANGAPQLNGHGNGAHEAADAQTFVDPKKKRQAEKDLRALEKRKKQTTNNPFLKR